jgi:hypothetical protein
MKRILLQAAIIAVMAASLQAQITVTNSTFPSLGDTLFTAVDNMPSGIAVTSPGGQQSWNFTTLQSPFVRRTVVKPAAQGPGSQNFPSASYYANISDNLHAYYRKTNSKVELLGFFGLDPVGLGVETATLITPPNIRQRAPLTYGATHTSEYNIAVPFSADDVPGGILNNLPITPDSLRIRINTQRTDEVDAWGALTIPGGIYDVLREKRTELRQTRIDAKIGFFPAWVDVTDIFVELLSLPGLGSLTQESYYFWSNEALEPIAVLSLSPATGEVQSVEYKANNISTNVQSVESLRPGVYAFPNPAIVNVRFEFSNLPPGRYRLKMLNILGSEVWNRSFYINGSAIEKVDISFLQKGTYIYTLVDERGKTITTRRLVVVRP